MKETKSQPNLEPEETIKALKNEMVVLTLNPDALHNYDTEDVRTQHIHEIKTQLIEHGVDADAVLRESIAANLNLKAPLDNIVEIDFTQKAS